MLKSVHFKNFKCLQDVSVDFEPLTILIGFNDSGKSSFLQAINYLKHSLHYPMNDNHRYPLKSIVWQGNKEQTISWKTIFEMDHKNVEYELNAIYQRNYWEHYETLNINEKKLASIEKNSDNTTISNQKVKGQPHYAHFSETLLAHTLPLDAQNDLPRDFFEVASYIDTFQTYQFQANKLAEPSILDVGKLPTLGYFGEGLPSLLDWLLYEHRENFLALEEEFCRIAPSLGGITLPLDNIVDQNNITHTGRRLEFFLKGTKQKIPASLVSEGVLLILAYLTLLYSPNRPRLLMLEEPDNYIHPRRMEFLMDKLREIASGELTSKPCQVIITTHNPLLLNFAHPKEVRIFTRDEEGATHIKPFSQVKKIDDLLEFMDLGELWYNMGEEELVKEKF